jgi:DNA polymerase I-like protein with 3'-5' exonuclease and polymerase domains
LTLLFEDLGVLKKRAVLKELPPVPDSGWRPPQYFPDLRGASLLSIDTETWERDFEHGPGWARGQSEICGFSVGAMMPNGDMGQWYFPIRHQLERDWNLDPKTSLSWLKWVMEETPTIPKVGANLIFDIGTLSDIGIWPTGELHDVQFAESLLNEAGEVNLDALGAKYCGEGKTSNFLYEWAAKAYGGSANPDQRANIYRCPPRLVGPYGEQDASLPIRVLMAQWPLLTADNLHAVYRMECDLIRLWIRMRIQGAAVDVPKAEQLYVKFGRDIKTMKENLKTLVGKEVNPDSSDSVGAALEAAGVPTVSKVTKGRKRYSVTKPWLETVDHPIAKSVLEVRALGKINSTFIRSYILERNIRGVVHCNFNPLRQDTGGTRTGRLSSDQPNLQNIPVRSDDGKLIRALFTFFNGHWRVEQGDQSQIEYRYLAEFATGPGAEELRARYNADPHTDYHDATYDRVCPYMGWDITNKEFRKDKRRPIKNINFGLVYGMGEPKLARDLKLSLKDAKVLFNAYHEGNPYVKTTMSDAASEASAYGYVTTILGRRRRFDLWEPIEYGDWTPLPFEAAIRAYGGSIQRAGLHRAINSKLQGSAAEQIKKAAHILLLEGVYDYTGVPMLQCHDEWLNSRIDDSPGQEEAYRYIKHVNETAIPLRIPLNYERGFGANWNEAK